MATRPYLLLLCLVGAKLRGAFSTLPVARLCFHIDVQYFATYLKMEHYSVYMRNILPSTAFVIGIPICVFWGFLSDRLGTRFGLCLGPLLWGLIPVGILAFWGPPTARLFAFMVEFTYFVTHICESSTPSAAEIVLKSLRTCRLCLDQRDLSRKCRGARFYHRRYH